MTEITRMLLRPAKRMVRRIKEATADESAPRADFFRHAFRALEFNGIGGDYAEFGSGWVIPTFPLAYRAAVRHGHPAKLWAFDSFRGLPAPQTTDDPHPHWFEGNMTTTLDQFQALCAKNGVPLDAYRAVPGFFEETIAKMSRTENPTDIALAYIDCDLYSSTKVVLDFLAPRLKHGMIVAFDDYFCWSASGISGERRAFLEFSAASAEWEWVPYIQYGWYGQSFVIEAKALRRNHR